MASAPKIRKIESPSEPPTKYETKLCAQSIIKMYLEDEMADVHFVFEMVDDVPNRVPAHKNILGSGSTVFRSMFYDTLDYVAEIEIKDVTCDGFKNFLKFFYFDAVAVAMEHVGEIMYLAENYEIPECSNVCKAFLNAEVPVEKVCDVLQRAVTFHRSDLLVSYLLAKISEKPTEVFTSNSFMVCSKSTLKLILQIDDLDQKAVFEACMAWSKNACERNNLDPLEMKNRREQLGDCFDLIKFDVMESPQISEFLAKYKGLYTQDDLVVINAILLNRKRGSQNVPKWNEKAFLTFSFTYEEKSNRHINQTEVSAFLTTKNLLLGAVGTPPICPKTDDKTKLSGIMRIVDCTSDPNILMLEQNVELSLGGSRNLIKLMEPVAIEPKTWYVIRIEFNSTWSESKYWTKKVNKKQTQLFGDFTLLFVLQMAVTMGLFLIFILILCFEWLNKIL